ncbi:hypothetical protein [Clostridium sp.]|uniref:hypothetical protein n=1 Tax=Clostridium sp. TaxID=1506 RepID=UPI002FC8D696
MYCRFPSNGEYFLRVIESSDPFMKEFIELDNTREDCSSNDKRDNETINFFESKIVEDKDLLNDLSKWKIFDDEFARDCTYK